MGTLSCMHVRLQRRPGWHGGEAWAGSGYFSDSQRTEKMTGWAKPRGKMPVSLRMPSTRRPMSRAYVCSVPSPDQTLCFMWKGTASFEKESGWC